MATMQRSNFSTEGELTIKRSKGFEEQDENVHGSNKSSSHVILLFGKKLQVPLKFQCRNYEKLEFLFTHFMLQASYPCHWRVHFACECGVNAVYLCQAQRPYKFFQFLNSESFRGQSMLRISILLLATLYDQIVSKDYQVKPRRMFKIVITIMYMFWSMWSN